MPFRLLAAIMFSVASACAVAAQTFPTRPVRIIVPYAPGGAVDTVARTVGGKLSETWGQTVVIENRPGGAANIGTELGARAAPDGHTLLMGTTANGVNLHLMKLTYNFERDLTPISLLDTFYNVLIVHPSFPAQSVKELIALAKAKPNELNYGSSGVASSNHFSGELFNLLAGVQMQHVPYKDANVAMADLLAARLSVYYPSVSGALPHIKSGKVRALGVTGSKRSVAAPQIPTIAETGLPGYVLEPWHGILAPAGTPKALIAKLNKDVVAALHSPEVTKRLLGLGIDNIIGSSPEAFAKFIREQMEKYGKLVKAAGIRQQ
ncbi:MAG TPA: tripartite tricarboxylate transporter substrate binding protein [Burkholderiales bacterium]|nr:tripartite tricarboxylate transporter substrate binding protein [Burkholderiales bacterium]